MRAADPDDLDAALARIAAGDTVLVEGYGALLTGVLYEARGELGAAYAAYELAAESGDERADAALFALEGNAGNPDAVIRLLPSAHDSDDALSLLHTINRAIWEWRRGHLQRARDLLLEADASGRSALGRAVEESVDASRPGFGARLLSPLLTLAGDQCVELAARAPVGPARTLLQRALALEPGHAEAALRLARLHAEGGELHEARQLLRAVLVRYPGWSEALALAAHLSAGQPQ